MFFSSLTMHYCMQPFLFQKAALSVQMDKLAQCKQKRRKLKNLSKLGENPLALEQPTQIV
ncbi:hypothetical protein T4E_5915 [Trichinella pseudospiralis]|uniref:Uncharacterized protein n=1 Tax=Trichinella pseudospiralis TaxID=6337 RepID=A0A0V0YAX7_TRIPS|nr:hypothetical protein T4E_5915 [Trichinella pseudospiralis]